MYSQNAFLLYNVNTFWAISHPPPPQGADVICEGPYVLMYHTLDISVEKKQVTLQQRSQHSQQNYHENLGLRKTLHPPKSTRLKLP